MVRAMNKWLHSEMTLNFVLKLVDFGVCECVCLKILQRKLSSDLSFELLQCSCEY